MKTLFKILLAIIFGLVFYSFGRIMLAPLTNFIDIHSATYDIISFYIGFPVFASLGFSLGVWLFEKKNFLKIWLWPLLGCALFSLFYAFPSLVDAFLSFSEYIYTKLPIDNFVIGFAVFFIINPIFIGGIFSLVVREALIKNVVAPSLISTSRVDAKK